VIEAVESATRPLVRNSVICCCRWSFTPIGQETVRASTSTRWLAHRGQAVRRHRMSSRSHGRRTPTPRRLHRRADTTTPGMLTTRHTDDAGVRRRRDADDEGLTARRRRAELGAAEAREARRQGFEASRSRCRLAAPRDAGRLSRADRLDLAPAIDTAGRRPLTATCCTPSHRPASGQDAEAPPPPYPLPTHDPSPFG